MFQLTQKQRENTNKALLSLMTVDAATLLAGNLFNPKGFSLPIFILGCILFIDFYLAVLWLER